MIGNLNYKKSKSPLLIIFYSTIFMVGCSEKKLELRERISTSSKNTLELIEAKPKNKTNFVNRNAKIILKFNNQLDPSTIKSNTKSNSCSGTIQITSNNFKTCVIMKKHNLINNNKDIILLPKQVYKPNTIYKIRLKKGLAGKKGSSLNNNSIIPSRFKTSWSHQFGTIGDDSGIAISVDTNDNIYLIGNTSADKSGEKTDLFLAKFVKKGYQRWIIQTGFERPVSSLILRIAKDNTILLSAFSNEIGNSALIISNYSFNGKKIFTKTILLNGDSKGNGLTFDKESNLYVTNSSPFDILKIGKNGEIIRGHDLEKGLEIFALTTDSSNNLYIAGSMNKSLDGKLSKGGRDIFLIKISERGLKIWSRTYGSIHDESVTSMSIKSNKAIAIVGYVTQQKKNVDIKKYKDAFIAKYNTKGELIWTHIFKGEKTEECTVSLWTSDGELIVGGYTESSLAEKSNGKEDAFVARFSNDGKLIWLKQFGTEQNERPLGLALGNEGQIYVTGYTEGRIDGAKYNGGRDIFLVKFDKNGIKQ